MKETAAHARLVVVGGLGLYDVKQTQVTRSEIKQHYVTLTTRNFFVLHRTNLLLSK